MIHRRGPSHKLISLNKVMGRLCCLSTCFLLNLCSGMDYGDAPDPSYPTLLANDGARHDPSGPSLGPSRDSEIDGQPDADATGDDVVGVDDEDGVTFGLLEVGRTTAVIVQVQAGSALLDAWLDYNQDGDWLDAGEQLASSLNMTIGSNSVPISIPCSATTGLTYARFRLSTAGGLLPTGLAGDGEVEDYAVTILPEIPTMTCPAIITLEFNDSFEPYRVPESPIVHYDFNNSAFEVPDISGSANVHNGFQAGSVNFPAGIEGGSADFIPDGCVQLQSHPELNAAPVNNRSISLWFIIDESLPPTRTVIYEEGNANNGISIYIQQASQSLNVGVWKGQGQGAGFSGIPGIDYTLVRSGIGSVSVGRWYHVAVVLDSATGTVSAHLDGLSLSTDTFGFPVPTHSGAICLGGMNDGTRFLDNGSVATGNGSYLNGRVDQFLLYNRTLTLDDIIGLADTNRLTNSAGAPVAVAGCSSNRQIDRNDIITPGACSNTWTITRTWSMIDAGGNSSACIQTLVANDRTSSCVDLSASLTDTPAPVIAGELLTYTITIENTGFDDATNVSVTMTLPDAVTPNGVIITNLGTIAGESRVSFPFQVAVDCVAFGSLTNTIAVSRGILDINPANDTATVVTPIRDLVVSFSETPPAWWDSRGTILPAAPAYDYAAVIQGQLKNLAQQTFNEIEAVVPCGAGAALTAVVSGFSPTSNNYSAVTVGQLKNLAQPFYARLAELGYSGSYPWTTNTTDDEDFGAANIGQTKDLFDFELSY